MQCNCKTHLILSQTTIAVKVNAIEYQPDFASKFTSLAFLQVTNEVSKSKGDKGSSWPS